LTILDHELHSIISKAELMDHPWSKGSAKEKLRWSPNIVQSIVRFNQLTAWVIREILGNDYENASPRPSSDADKSDGPKVLVSTTNPRTPKARANVMKHLIMTAQHCRNLQNFNSLKAIMAGMTSSSIWTLTKSWDMIPRRHMQLFEELEALVNPENNYQLLRTTLQITEPPSVPWLGLLLKDLTFVEETPVILRQRQKSASLLSDSTRTAEPTPIATSCPAESTILTMESMSILTEDLPASQATSKHRPATADSATMTPPDVSQLINFSRCRHLANIIGSLQQSQQVPYALQPVPQLQSMLFKILEPRLP
jgi:hypothetical protein